MDRKTPEEIEELIAFHLEQMREYKLEREARREARYAPHRRRRVVSQETRDKLSAAAKARWEERRAEGRVHHSEETRKKMSRSQTRRWKTD